MSIKRGSINLIIGGMYSGKSSRLIEKHKRFVIAKKKCIFIKYGNDTRYSIDKASTHSNITYPAISSIELFSIPEETFHNVDVISIDEIQFFPDAVEFCELYANKGVILNVAGLDGKFDRSGFPRVLSLIPLSETVEKLNAVCMMCGYNASISMLIDEDSPKSEEMIGGVEKYMAVCRECFIQAKAI